MSDNSSSTFTDWDDEFFIGYVETHSETPRALFSREMVLRFCKLVAVPEVDIPMGAFIQMDSSYVQEVLKLYRAKHTAPAPPLKKIKLVKGASPYVRCQEASVFSKEVYIPCNAMITSLIENKDSHFYFMCQSCTYHNVKNRGAKVIAEIEWGNFGE